MDRKKHDDAPGDQQCGGVGAMKIKRYPRTPETAVTRAMIKSFSKQPNRFVAKNKGQEDLEACVAPAAA